jgi:hypothetical protein
MIVKRGVYYEFHRLQSGREVGSEISRGQATLLLKGGRDVYTPARADAYSLATTVFHAPIEHPPHAASYFGHYQGPFPHEYKAQKIAVGWDKADKGGGHIFFNSRGEDFLSKAAKQETELHQHNVERHKKSYL